MNKPLSRFKFYSALTFKLYPISLLKVDATVIFNAMQRFLFAGNFFDRNTNNSTNRVHSNVLIAVNSKLSLPSKVVPIKCAAELLAIELILLDSTKIIISTCYRVGTLGMANCNEIMQALNKLSRKKMLVNFW